MLDRVSAGDPGTPARVIVPDVAGQARAALRWGELLVRQDLLAAEELDAARGPLTALSARARGLEG